MRLRVSAVLFAGIGALFLLAGCSSNGDGNQPPTVTVPTLTVVEDNSLSALVSATDPEGDPITFALVTNAQHGTATVSASGQVSYVPAANYSGPDSFTISATDDKGDSANAVVNITVSPVNDAPDFTSATTLATNEDITATLQLTASDPDANPLTYSLVNNVQHGTVTVSAAGAVSYSPASNYSGSDSFSARVSDGAGAEDNVVVTITVTPVNDAPALLTTQFTATEDGVLNAQLLAADIEGQAVQFLTSGSAAHGAVSISASGLLTYMPSADFFGTDTLTVGLTDGITPSSPTISVSVTPVNDPPRAVDDELRVPATAATVAIPVRTNDVDVDGDTLTLSVLTQPSVGSLAVNSSNEIVFTRENAFSGPIEFTYRVTDAAGITDDASVRAVIGEFTGLYFLSDETTPGIAELHFFDGLRVSRINSALDPGESISAFSVSSDGSYVGYIVVGASVDRVYLTPAQAPAPYLAYTSALKSGPSVALGNLRLSRNGAYFAISDPNMSPFNFRIVRASDGLSTRVGSNNPQVVAGGYLALSPANDNFYPQIQVGGTTSMSGTGYLTLFEGNLATPGDVTQRGLTYPAPSQGGGSGIIPAVTADGRYVIHQEALFSPFRNSVLVYDSVTRTESAMYRRPTSGEIGMWDGFDISNDGRRVCFRFRGTEPGGSSGPSRFIVGDPAAPASAGPVTPLVDNGYTCEFGSDNRTLFYLAQTAAVPAYQMYAVDSSVPGTPVAVNRPYVSGEVLEDWWVARDAMRLVFGTRGISAQLDYYSVSLDDPTRFIVFATNTFDDGSLPGQIDSEGLLWAYSRRPAPLSGLRRLTLLSTQTANFSMSLTRADTVTGLIQFEWAP